MSTAKSAKTKATTTTKVAVKKASVIEFTNDPWTELDPRDYAIDKWVNSHCGGDTMNVIVVPLEDKERHLKFEEKNPIGQRYAFPFGYRRVPGTRALYHDWHAYGVDGDNRLGTMLRAMHAMDKHDVRQMICTVALLNGGDSRSQKTWGQPFIKLVYVPPTK